MKWISFAVQISKSNFHKSENGSLWVFLKHQLFTQTVGHDKFYGTGDENGKYDYMMIVEVVIWMMICLSASL